MATRKVAAVFGGSGFIGRYVVKRLAASGYIVRVPVRDPEAARFLMVDGAVGQIVPLYASLADPATVARGVEDADLVVNLVGILSERQRGDFVRIQTDGAGGVAQAAADAGVARLVHVSAIGADPASPSHYASSKGRGEQAVRAAFPDATILRPSIVFGPEDGFFNRFGAMAQFSPIMPVICGSTRFQPVYVGDVADAVMVALTGDMPRPGVYELGGPDILTFRALLQYILKVTRRKRPLVAIPDPVASLQAAVMERLPNRPFTRDQLLLLQRDNVVTEGAAGFAALGLTPTGFELIVPTYLSRFRPAGGSGAE
jgi:NADH dehydrogenase